jgi:group I intron endonuclease
MIGVYCIKNITNNKIYIGSSKHVEARWKEHVYLLENKKHHSVKLQKAWNKYGSGNFKFEVLETTEDKNLLFIIEQQWLDKTKSYENGYNICAYAGEVPYLELYKYKTKQQFLKFQKEYYKDNIAQLISDLDNYITLDKVELKVDIREKEYSTIVYNKQALLLYLLPTYYKVVVNEVLPLYKNKTDSNILLSGYLHYYKENTGIRLELNIPINKKEYFYSTITYWDILHNNSKGDLYNIIKYCLFEDRICNIKHS